MNRHLTAALALLVLGCAYCAHSGAATPLPPAPGNGWCSDGSNTTGYFGVRACQGVTPPPVDAGALLRGNVTYQDGGTVQNVDLTQMANVYGRASATEPVKGWAFAGGSRPKLTLPIGKHLNMGFFLDGDSTGTTGSIQGSQYGSSNRAIYVQVLESLPGSAPVPVFYRDHDSRGRPLLFNESPWIFLVRNQPRTESKCPVRAGYNYQVVIGYLDQRGGTMVTQWQGN